MSDHNLQSSIGLPANGDPATIASHGVESQPMDGTTSDSGLATSTADLANLLANGQWGTTAEAGHAGPVDLPGAYDGHVALALDPGVLPDIDTTLDMLTSSHDLFDVPPLDVSGVMDDASST